MTKSNFVLYAEKKAAIAELEAELEALKPLILEEMPPETPVDLEGYGVFSLVPKKSWKYTEATESLRTKLKDEEKLEQKTGTAIYTENPYLLFKSAK